MVDKLIDTEDPNNALPKYDWGLITERYSISYCHCPRCLNNMNKNKQGYRGPDKKDWSQVHWCCYECGWEGYEDQLLLYYNDGEDGICLNVQ